MICDVYMPETPFAGCPRMTLKRQVERAKKLGYTMVAGPEAEFFLFQKDADGEVKLETHDVGGYFDLTPVDKGEECRRDIVVVLEAMGFEVEAAHHEVAPSQHEIDFKYSEAIACADNVATFRFVVKKVALDHGLHATFMPKPIFGLNGSGMHVHQSLLNTKGQNAFYDPDGEWQLSKLALCYIGGILVRVPAKRGMSTRCEVRMPAPSCNPYLALAVMMAAGLDGVENQRDPGPPINKNIFTMSHREKRRLRIGQLPPNLWAALEELEKDEVIKGALGEHILEHYLRAKRQEWEEYISHVHPWEQDRYLSEY